MLYFDFVNPYLVYVIYVFLAMFTVYAIFTYRDFFKEHNNTVMLIVSVLLIWTQLARYIGVIFTTGFTIQENLPFYMCRLSVLVLLYYTLTQDKRVESFLFFWGATGLAGVIYPNGPMDNIANLTETFFIDHYVLAVMPFYLVSIKGYIPRKRDMYMITGLMAMILFLFIPINQIMGADYFYLNDQSIIGIIAPGLPSVIFAVIHSLVALGFFSIYYNFFKNKDFRYGE